MSLKLTGRQTLNCSKLANQIVIHVVKFIQLFAVSLTFCNEHLDGLIKVEQGFAKADIGHHTLHPGDCRQTLAFGNRSDFMQTAGRIDNR